MRKIMMLLPIAVLALSITYAGFSSTLHVGSPGYPNTVQTGTLEWTLYLPSELGWPISILPDIIDSVYNPSVFPPVILPEKPDIATASISKSGDTVSITLTNVYPGYGAVAHFIYKNEGTIPSKLREVNITINDPYNVAKDVRTAVIIVWSTTGGSLAEGAAFIGFNLTDLPGLIEQALGDKVFQPGGWVAFCKPNNTTVTITDVEINPNSGLPQDMIDYLNNTDSFWIIIPPNSTPPQGAWLSFNLTLTFGQFNE